MLIIKSRVKKYRFKQEDNLYSDSSCIGNFLLCGKV